jgi:hypothetical protein
MPEPNAAGGPKGEPQDAAGNPSCPWMLCKIKLDPGLCRDDGQELGSASSHTPVLHGMSSS